MIELECLKNDCYALHWLCTEWTLESCDLEATFNCILNIPLDARCYLVLRLRVAESSLLATMSLSSHA